MPANGLAALIFAALLCTLQAPPPQTPPTTPPAPAKPASPPTAPPTKAAPTPQTPPTAPAQPAAPTAPSSGTQTPPTSATTQKPQTPAEIGVTAEPDPCIPGQTVTFTLPAGVTRATVTGGRFARHQEIKEPKFVTDTPHKPTYYTFDLWYTGDSAGDNKPAPQAAQHRQIKIAVDVYTEKFPPLVTYQNADHWRIDCVAGWNRNVIPQDDPADNCLVYFQPQADSPERIAVAMLPVKDQTAADLMKQVLMDAPTQYNVLRDIQQKQTTHCGVDAVWATFTGIDQSLPDMPTKSMVLAFIYKGRGYVISGRARASRYDQWEKLLHSLVRSFYPTSVHPTPEQPDRQASKSAAARSQNLPRPSNQG